MIDSPRRRLRIIGPGRAGTSLARAVATTGWATVELWGRDQDPGPAATGVDLVVIATPDRAIAAVAASIIPGEAVVAHLAGSRPLSDLAPHEAAAIHPLASLPDTELGAARLLDSCPFAVAGHPIATELATALGGKPFAVDDEQRALYHATASVAANHLVALLAQVERLANQAQVPLEAFWPLIRGAVANATDRGPAAALTGPAARGDQATITAHLSALPPSERDLYRCLARAAAELAGTELDLDLPAEES